MICKICPKTSDDFKNERSFYHHEKNHEEKNEECPDCKKLFRTKMDLSSHRNNVHEEKQEYKCNHCEEVFSKRSNLKRHIDGFCGQYFQKYHPLGFSKYCVNMKTSCIRQNFKYIDYFRKIH